MSERPSVEEEREADWQSRQAVLEDLCSLCSHVRSHLARTENTAADCFCPGSLAELLNVWEFSPRVMDFIWEAVSDRVARESEPKGVRPPGRSSASER